MCNKCRVTKKLHLKEIKTFCTVHKGKKSQMNINFVIEIMITLLTLTWHVLTVYFIFFPISEKNMASCMVENPWLVESINAFYFLKCPQCEFNTKIETFFQTHALAMHPMSCVLFGNTSAGWANAHSAHPVPTPLLSNQEYFKVNKVEKEQLSDDIEKYPPEQQDFNKTELESSSKETNIDNLKCEIKQEQFENKQEFNEEFYADEEDYNNDESVSEQYDYNYPEISLNESTNQKLPLLIGNSKNSAIFELKQEGTEYEVGESSNSGGQTFDVWGASNNIEGQYWRPFPCTLCSMSFKEKPHLTKHIKIVHEKKKPYKCSVCEYTSKDKHNLKVHFEAVHEGKKPFQCDICQKCLATKQSLKNHLIQVHDGAKGHQCTLCEFSTATKQQLHRHISSVHERSKQFKCLMCESSFSLKGNLKQHVKTVHMNERPFACAVCDYSAKYKRDLDRHVELTHQSDKGYQCLVCEASFSQQVRLLRHVETVHEGKEFPGEKQYKCPQCASSFSERFKLKRHIECVHEGKKPFECPHCSIAFAHKQHLKNHIGSFHGGMKPFECPVCKKNFSEKGQLNKHCSKVHEEKDFLIETDSLQNVDDFESGSMKNEDEMFSVHEEENFAVDDRDSIQHVRGNGISS